MKIALYVLFLLNLIIMTYSITGNLVDVINETIIPSEVTIENGIIADINSIKTKCDNFIIPPFVDSHLHFESSMLMPSEFARNAAIHGTVGIISDPHEIANVLGMEGIKYFIDDIKNVPTKIFFGAPPCVPATDFETAGATITTEDIEELFKNYKLNLLSEVMNFPGVINDEENIINKIKIAKTYGKVIDGHCPKLTENDLKKYINAGISTDHEVTKCSEAEEKIANGMIIQIRNGSAAKNFNRLYPLIDKYPDKLMFCSDDLEPNDLKKGHINLIVKEAIKRKMNIMNILKIASINPIKHYNINVGTLKIKEPADFLIVNNLNDMEIIKTFCNGNIIAENGSTNIKYKKPKIINNFNAEPIKIEDIQLKISNKNQNKTNVNVNVIRIMKKTIITQREIHNLEVKNGYIMPKINRTKEEINKLVIVNRYKKDTKPAVAFVVGFGFDMMAIASSVSHDSHNIIAIGGDDMLICEAINKVIEAKGGIAVTWGNKNKLYHRILKLPIAGLISDLNIEEVTKTMDIIKKAAEIESKTNSPFMMLSFLSLLVIPEIKLSDKGLFDVNKFEFMNIEAE